MLDGWEDVEGIIKACFYVTEIIKTELTTEKTRELVTRKYYEDL